MIVLGRKVGNFKGELFSEEIFRLAAGAPPGPVTGGKRVDEILKPSRLKFVLWKNFA